MNSEAPAGATREISVVIPFFQRAPGILAKAVTSALSQQGVATPRVIVVDDSSPVRADDELQPLLKAFPEHLLILRQENGGPGAARNRGIEHARRDSKYIALLDSDDSWAPAHLATAKRALDRGFDFYFCDAVHRDGARTIFETREIPAAECERIDAEQNIFAYTGSLFERILIGCPIQASAVVYRASAFPMNFRADLRAGGEDHFFWMEAASRSEKTVFCTTPNVRLSYGVNIYNGVDWGSPEMLWRAFYDQTCMMDAAGHFAASRSYRPAIQARIRRYRHEFIENMISVIWSSRRSEALPVMIKYFRTDPAGLLRVPPVLLRRLSGRLRLRPKARLDGPTQSPAP